MKRNDDRLLTLLGFAIVAVLAIAFSTCDRPSQAGMDRARLVDWTRGATWEVVEVGSGRLGIFGGPREVRHERRLPCALYPAVRVGDLDPGEHYAAIRYTRGHNTEALRRALIMVEDEDRGRVAFGRLRDFGPARWTGRIVDVSPSFAEALGVATDARVRVRMFIPNQNKR